MTRTPCLAAAALLLMAASPAPAVDHVAIYDRPPPTRGKPVEQTVRQHAGRIRIDSRLAASGATPAFVSSDYQASGQTAAFSVGRLENGRLVWLQLMDDPDTSPPPVAARTVTGETQTVLGEACRVWRASRPTPYGFTFVQSGCRTGDGVELWRRMATVDYVVARQVRRGPVSAAEVRPPMEALDLTRWVSPAQLRPGSRAAHAGDYEVVFSGVQQRVARRSGAWTSVSERRSALTYATVEVINAADHVRFVYRRQRDQRTLQIDAMPGRLPPVIGDGGAPVRLHASPDEVILGETCAWWDVAPNVTDFSRSECRTRDGVTLKIRTSSRGSEDEQVAVRLKRGPQPLRAVLPDPALTAPAAWGF